MEATNSSLTLIGAELRRLRRSKGYSLSDVNKNTGLSVSFLSDIERGVTWPSLGTLISLARHYEVAPWRVLAILPD